MGGKRRVKKVAAVDRNGGMDIDDDDDREDVSLWVRSKLTAGRLWGRASR